MLLPARRVLRGAARVECAALPAHKGIANKPSKEGMSGTTPMKTSLEHYQDAAALCQAASAVLGRRETQTDQWVWNVVQVCLQKTSVIMA